MRCSNPGVEPLGSGAIRSSDRTSFEAYRGLNNCFNACRASLDDPPKHLIQPLIISTADSVFYREKNKAQTTTGITANQSIRFDFLKRQLCVYVPVLT